MTDEQTLYEDADVAVTGSRFMHGKAMYPIRNITSVSTTEQITPAPRGMSSLMFLLALCSTCLATKSDMPLAPIAVITLPLLALTIFFWRREKPKTTWAIMIHTSGVQTKTLETSDRTRHDAVLNALHRAVAGG